MGTIHELPVAQGMSEFGQYTGDCMWASLLVCLHSCDPEKYPADLATLNALVTKAIAAGDTTGPEGQATMQGVASFVQADADMAGRVGTLRGYDGQVWAMDSADGWHPWVTVRAGYEPILLQVANGGAFGIEPALRGHAIAILGQDTDGYELCADPCNPACYGGALVRYSVATVDAAQPIAALSFKLPVTSEPTPPPPTEPTPAPVPPADPDPDDAQLASLTARVATLEQQLAAAQQQYASLQAAAGSGAVEAVALVRALQAALKAIAA